MKASVDSGGKLRSQFLQRQQRKPEKLVARHEFAANREADDAVVGVVRELRAEQLGHLAIADNDELPGHRMAGVTAFDRSRCSGL
jgi:hypothetical protein